MKRSFIIPAIVLLLTTAAVRPQEPQVSLAPADSFFHAESMKPGGVYAATGVPDPHAGGFGESGNLPRPIPEGLSIPKGKLSLIALPNQTVRIGAGLMALLLVNDTSKEVWCEGFDSRMSVIQEATNSAGQWKPLEFIAYPEGGVCGNSFHRLALPPSRCWVFPIRRYQGSQSARLRLFMPELRLYSNEFEGSINPGQFGYWEKDKVVGEEWLPHEVPKQPPTLKCWGKVDPHSGYQGGYLPAFIGAERKFEFDVTVLIDPVGAVSDVVIGSYHMYAETFLPQLRSIIRRSSFAPGSLEGKPVHWKQWLKFPLVIVGPKLINGHPAFRVSPVQDDERGVTLLVDEHGKASMTGGRVPIGSEAAFREAYELAKVIRFSPATVDGIPIACRVAMDLVPGLVPLKPIELVPARMKSMLGQGQ